MPSNDYCAQNWTTTLSPLKTYGQGIEFSEALSGTQDRMRFRSLAIRPPVLSEWDGRTAKGNPSSTPHKEDQPYCLNLKPSAAT